VASRGVVLHTADAGASWRTQWEARAQACQLLPPPIPRFRFKFQSHLVWLGFKKKTNPKLLLSILAKPV
jgi:hypothetical protein